MDTNEIIAICFASLLSIIFISLLISHCIYVKRVKNKSKIYKYLLELNAKKKFNTIKPKLKYSRECNSKRQLENLNFNKEMRQIVKSDFNSFCRILHQLQENQSMLDNYLIDSRRIWEEYKSNHDEIKAAKVPIKKWQTVETKLYRKNLLSPVTNIEVRIHATYISPKGRNAYYIDAKFYQSDIDRIVQEIQFEEKKQAERERYELEKVKMREQRLAQRDAHQTERNKLTKKLRFEILERDNYKCCICGRTAKDGIVLHVDHIVPVSKGGLTTLDNLRTLCADCNLGKSDRLEKNNDATRN